MTWSAEPASGQKPEVPRASADLNVTPLIDILLVLLIIFLMQMPMSQGLDVNLPEVERQETPLPAPSTDIVLEYAADRRITVNAQPVELASLEGRLRDIFAIRRDRTLFFRGDGALKYGEVIYVIDAARGAGVTRVGVVTDGALAATR